MADSGIGDEGSIQSCNWTRRSTRTEPGYGLPPPFTPLSVEGRGGGRGGTSLEIGKEGRATKWEGGSRKRAHNAPREMLFLSMIFLGALMCMTLIVHCS